MRHNRRNQPSGRADRVIGKLLIAASLTALATGGAPCAAVEDSRTVAAPSAPAALPLTFIPNVGQFHPDVRFRAVTGDETLFFTDVGVTAVGDAEGVVSRADFANPVGTTTVRGTRRLPGVAHFLRGDDPKGWHPHVPTFSSVVYTDVFPGVDVRFDGASGVLSIAATAAPYAEPEDVMLAEGAIRVVREATHRGSTVRPAQTVTRRLAYSTYLGGSFSETVRGLAVNDAGYAHIAGTTSSANYPTQDPLQGAIGNSGSIEDAFVAKLTPTGDALVYSTFLGGARQDEASAIALGRDGSVTVTGYTTSENFPTVNAVQEDLHLASGIWSGDLFVTRLSQDGSAIVFSTFLGGTGRDLGKAIAVDAKGHTYVTGATGSNFPAVNAIHPLNRGVRDAFITKFAPAGDDIVYSTHLGGTDRDEAWGIDVDDHGNAYIVGTTRSRNFRTTAPFQRTYGGETDAFVAKINDDGSAFVYSTYYGARNVDEGVAIAVTKAGEAVILGRTMSTGLPRRNAFQGSPRGASDMFLAKLNAAGDDLVFSTYFGGSGTEAECLLPDVDPGLNPSGSRFTPETVGSISLDDADRIYVAGCTRSPNLPLMDPIQSARLGTHDGFISVFSADATSLLFSTFVGGRQGDVPRAIGLDAGAAIYSAGLTNSTNFPTVSPVQADRAGVADAFALKIDPVVEPPPTATPVATPTLEPTPTAPSTSPPTVTVTPSPTPLQSPTAALRTVLYVPIAYRQ